MGVKDLWSIISPVCEKKSLWELENRTIAIDLSAWICDSQSIYAPAQANMYLRNIFFRTSYLLLLGVKPIFVLEGQAPDLKATTIRNRLNRGNENPQPTEKKVTRTRLAGLQKQCVELLSSLGLSYVKGPGEAEAYCAHLNALGIADGIITQDSDAFLYGAKEVYRNFQMSPHYTCDRYSMDVIQSKLGLSRRRLVGFSLLVGSDYGCKVQKLSKTDALNFILSIPEEQIIQRFVDWRSESVFTQITGSTKYLSKDAGLELKVREKCLADPLFPDLEVVTEYMKDPAIPASFTFEWSKPNLAHFVGIAVKKLQWEEEYAVSKLSPLLARWHLLHPSLQSECLVAAVLGVPTGRNAHCFRVQWEGLQLPAPLVSLEPKELVERAYPQLVNAFLESKNNKKKKTTRKNKVKSKVVEISSETSPKSPLKCPSREKTASSADADSKKKTAEAEWNSSSVSELDLSAIVRDIVSRPVSNPALKRLQLS